MTRAANTAARAPSVRRNALGLAFAVLAFLVPASAASAATTLTDYAPNTSSRTFTPNVGGWTSAVERDPLCALACPGVTNSYEPSGGAFGPTDGYIRTSLSGLLAADDASARGIWTSPTFKYEGDRGEKPTDVNFFMGRRADVDALLVDAGNQATFDVDLIETAGDFPISLIKDQRLEGPEGFTAVTPVDVEPFLLSLGKSYQIRITTNYRTAATLIPNATADYDNVTLRASTTVGQRGKRGGRGSRGRGGRNGGESKADRELKRQLRKINVTARRVSKRTIKVTVGCPKQQEKVCRFQLRAQLNRFGNRLSRTLRTNVQPGKRKAVRLKLLSGRLDELDGRRRITIRAGVSSGEAKTEVFYRPRLRNNRPGRWS